MTATAAEPRTLLSPPVARVSVGVFALAFLFAFEALAVSTVMPQVAAELDGLTWYPVAFSGPLAAAVVALAVSGPLIDRLGTATPLVAGLAVFVAGVLVAGLAPSMPLLLVGRAVHGLGGGMLGVALYALVAAAYPVALRPRVFAMMTAAWVLPALVGPVMAAWLAELLGWRAVFLTVPPLAVAAWLLLRSAGSRGGAGGAGPMITPSRVALSALAAGGVAALGLAGRAGAAAVPLAAAGLAAVLLAGPRLLPRGSWTGRRGLPSVLGARALIGTAFGAAEVYVPLLLRLERDLTLAQAGAVLTVGAVTWCLGAQLAARVPALGDAHVRVRIGAALSGAGVVAFAAAAAPTTPIALPIAAWAVAGLGIGMAMSSLSVLALELAPPGEAARAPAALQLNDYLVQAAAIALGGVLFALLADAAPVAASTALILAAGAAGLFALVPAFRMRPSGPVHARVT